MMEHDEILELDYDEEFSEYTPLERPSCRPNNIPSVEEGIQDDSFEEGEELSEESSDTDSDCGPTRTKVRICQTTKNDMNPIPIQQRKVPNNIWANQLQESSLTEQLVHCSVKHMNIDNSRSVESYDYRAAQQMYNNIEELNDSEPITNRKRQYNNRFNKRPIGSSNKRPPKIILDLKVTEEDTCEEVATDIANKLGEEKDFLILRVVELMGKERAIQLYNKTKEIEANGGMDVLNHSRRRTSGGIFLMLVKKDKHTSQSIKKKIFDTEKEKIRGVGGGGGVEEDGQMKEINLRKKSLQERLGPLNPLNNTPLNTFASRFSPKSGSDDLEEGECIDEEDKSTLSNPPPSPESE